MHFTAPLLAAPPHHCPPPPHSIVRSSHQIWPPLLSLLPLQSQFSATGPAPHLHRCRPPQFMHTLPIPQPTARIQRRQSIGPRCAGRLLISSAVPQRRCGLQSLGAGLPALLSIALNSRTPHLPDLPLSPSSPAHRSTTTPSTSLGPSPLHRLASL